MIEAHSPQEQRIKIIAARSKNNVIGQHNALPWQLPADLAYFRQHTLGQTVIMGRRTWESLGKRALPKRYNIVVSSTLPSQNIDENLCITNSLEAGIALAKPNSSIYIIGGEALYAAAIASGIVEEMLITEIDAVYEGDTHFPVFDTTKWQITKEEKGTDTHFPHAFRFRCYERRPTHG